MKTNEYSKNEGKAKEKSYRTKQKEALLWWFASHPGDCFTAKDLIENPEISLGEATVFRLLARLTKENRLKRYVGAGTSLYQYAYDGACQSHFHLKCLTCGQVIHLNCHHMTEIETHIAKEHDFVVDVSSTVIYGTCAACRAAKEPGGAADTSGGFSGVTVAFDATGDSVPETVSDIVPDSVPDKKGEPHA